MRDLNQELEKVAHALSGIDGGIAGTGDPTLVAAVVQVAEAMNDIASAIRQLAMAVQGIDPAA